MHIFDISLFGFQISPTWYGLMYSIGFIICYFWMSYFSKIEKKELDSLLIYVFFGVILGGRLGYVLLYDFSYFTSHPRAIFEVWKGGMSFHGGLIGVITAIFLFSKKYQKPFFSITDPLAVIIPLAIGLGRIGNYINKELLGYSPYSGPFPMIIGGVEYFPSPLLEMALEGVALFIVMCFVAKNLGYFQRLGIYKTQLISRVSRISQKQEVRDRKIFSKGAYGPVSDGEINFSNEEIRSFSEIRGLLSGVFLIGYGTARMISEFFRLPDGHIGYLLGTDWLTLGMIYTLPLIFCGGILLILRGEEEVSPEGKIR